MKKEIVLTPREFQVFYRMTKGKTYKQIGIELSISTRMVIQHSKILLGKLNIKNRYRVVAIAKDEAIKITVRTLVGDGYPLLS